MNYPNVAGRTIAVDTETTGLRRTGDTAFALAVSTESEDYCFDLRDQNAVSWAKDHLPSAKTILGFNWKFDLHFLHNLGIDLHHVPCIDGMIATALLDEHRMSYDLDSVAMDYLGQRKDLGIYEELAQAFGGKATRKAQAGNFHRGPWEIISRYAKRDTRLTYDLCRVLMPLVEEQGLTKAWDLEMRLLPVLLRMERHGIRVDVAGTEAAVVEVSRMAEEVKARVEAQSWKGINVNSPQQVLKLFAPKYVGGVWVAADGTFMETTDKGAPSVAGEFLERCALPVAKDIVELKGLLKLQGTFLEGHILKNHVGGRVHANFNQTKGEKGNSGVGGTGSGRLSCDTPNLQQVSKRNKKLAAIVRRLFLPDEGHEWSSGDYSQIDFRIMAHYLSDKKILAVYAENPGTDFHQMVADMTGLPRNATPGVIGYAKAINLGISFGMSAGRLCQEMGLGFTRREWKGREILVPGPEGERIFASYHRKFPSLRPMLQRMTDRAKTVGYVRTILGRRARFPNGIKTHAAGPYLFQGGAAELMKTKLVEMDKVCRDVGDAVLIGTVHDEASFSHAPGERLRNLLKECMEDTSTFPLRVPILSEWEHGDNWAQASGLTEEK